MTVNQLGVGARLWGLMLDLSDGCWPVAAARHHCKQLAGRPTSSDRMRAAGKLGRRKNETRGCIVEGIRGAAITETAVSTSKAPSAGFIIVGCSGK